MKISKFTIAMFCAYFALLTGVNAQDARFSQYFSSPHLVNPAFTSLYEGDYKIMMNYRSQWGNIMQNPFRTFSFSGDMKVMSNRGGDYMGVGVNMLVDRAGDLNYGTTQANVAMAYYKTLDGYGQHYLALGFSGGYAQRKLDYDPNTAFLDVSETIPTEEFNFFDLSTGIMWSYLVSTNSYYYLGLAGFHLNQPEQSHFVEDFPLSGGMVPLGRRLVLHGGGSIDLADRINLLPSFIGQIQGDHLDVNFGAMVKYRLTHRSSKEDNAIYFGTYYRWQDAFILASRLDLKEFYLTVSYDITTSALSEAAPGSGSMEVSIAKIIFRNNKRSFSGSIRCPKF